MSDNVVIELPDFDAMLREANGMLQDKELGLKLADKIADYSEQFTPYNTGELFDSLRVEPFKLVYDCDYAEEVYDSDLYNNFLEKLDAKPSILSRLLSVCQIFEHCDPNCRTWSYLRQLIHKHKDFENYNPIFDGLIKEIQNI